MDAGYLVRIFNNFGANQMDERVLNLLVQLGEHQVEAEKTIDKNFDNYWNSLTEEQQLAAFYSVVKRIVKSEQKGRSYREILCTDFGFPAESYHLGLLCNFMWLHNNIRNSK